MCTRTARNMSVRMASTPAAANDWQLGCKEIKQRGARLLQSGQLSDCTFLLGSMPNQSSFAGHKFIFAMASPAFEAMFYGSMAEKKDPIIHITDIEPDTFKDLLTYIYTDEIKLSSFEKACDLYYAAKKYLMLHLKEQCLNYLQSNLKPENVCQAYEFAKFNDEQILMNNSIQTIIQKTTEVLQHQNFLEVELDTVVTIFSLDELNIDSELDLFNAATRYLEAQEDALNGWKLTSMIEKAPCQNTKSVEPSKAVNVENKTETSVTAVSTKPSGSTDSASSPSESKFDQDGEGNFSMRRAIEKIRFLSLTPKQFAGGPARSKFLTESEAYAIFMNMLNSWTDVPMPQGFSTSKMLRKLKDDEDVEYED